MKVGSGWQLAYFDQTGEDLDADATLVEAIGAGSDRVTINGQSRHCIGYLQDFLFTPQRSRQPVRALSGGERARLLLARLFTRPFNLLVLDEPTNDLDIETLELLVERLLEYEGTLLVVSHDRQFLDNVVTSLLVFRGEGEVEPFLGSYSDWLAYQQRRQSAQPFADTLVEESAKPAQGRRARSSAPKLSYKDQRELEGLPQQIEEQEEECDRLRALLSDPDFYREAESARVAEVTQALKDAEGALELIYQRWELLEAINNEVNSS